MLLKYNFALSSNSHELLPPIKYPFIERMPLYYLKLYPNTSTQILLMIYNEWSGVRMFIMCVGVCVYSVFIIEYCSTAIN